MIVLPTGAVRKPGGMPQINPQHPLAPYVCLAFYFNDGPLGAAKQCVDISRNRFNTTATTSPLRQAGDFGREIVFSGSNWLDVPKSGLFTTGTKVVTAGIPITVIARIKSTSVQTQAAVASSNFTTNGVDWALSLTQNSINTGAGGMGFYNGSAWVGTGVNNTVIGDGLYHIVGGTIEPRVLAGVSNRLTYYVDGVQNAQNTAAASTAFGDIATNGVSLGTYSQQSSQCMIGSMDFFLFLRGIALNPAQMLAFAKNPYAIVAPPTRRLFPSIAAGGAGAFGRRTYVIAT